MSTSTSLYSVQQNLFRFGGPIFLAIGNISCILNLVVFTKSTLRKNPCALCFVASNIIDFLFLYLSLLLTLLQAGYDVNPGASNIAFCRSFYYVGLVLACLGPSYLILASIDRTLVTSRNAGTRKWSTRRLAIVCIFSLALFWILFHIHALIYMEILQFGPNYFVCYFQPGAYTTFITYYSLFINGIIPPLLMAIFGFLTVKNIRQVRHATRPSHATHLSHASMVETTAVGRAYTVQSKDRQLIRMLLIEIIIYIIARFPSTIVLIYQQITQYQTKSAERITIEQFIANVTYFSVFIDSSISCYTNLLVSKTFRAELKRIFLENRLFRCRRPH